MDESQADMVIKDDDLADTGADRPSAFVVEITEASRVANFRCIRGDRSDQVAQFQHDIPDLRRDMIKIMDNTGSWKHGR